jgi:hypothetical protein
MTLPATSRFTGSHNAIGNRKTLGNRKATTSAFATELTRGASMSTVIPAPTAINHHTATRGPHAMYGFIIE